MTDQRQAAVTGDDALGRVDGSVEQFDRARLRRISPEQADLLQVRQMGMHRR
jgi:hypothetical protein